MKKVFKKILKWTGITLLLLIILLILVPILFKDQIKEMVIDEVNHNLKAELSLEDFDLTFISTFPNMTVELHNAKLTGKNEFKGVELMKIEKLSAHVGFWSVVAGDKVEIDEIHVENPVFDVRVLENGLANYDIVKSEEEKTPEDQEPSNFELSLKEYSIKNGKVIYDDRASNMYMELDNLNHTGKGDLTAEVFDFETVTTMDKITYRMDGINYLTEVKTDATVNMLMEMKEKSSKFTLKDNKIKLNEVELSVDGFYEMLEGYDQMDLKLDASKTTFKNFLSLIPTFYHSGYEGMVSSGDIAINGFVKGKLDDVNLPGWDLGMKVTNGSIKYPDLPGKIKNIQVNAGSKFAGGENLDKLTVDVPKFHADFSKNTIDANLFMRTVMTDPNIKSKINAHVDLSTLKDFVPMAKGESYSGLLDADVDINGNLSALEDEDYEAFTAKGVLELSEMIYKSPDLPDEVDINHMKFTFSPQNLQMNELNAKMGKSDFQVDGTIDNYLAYAMGGEEDTVLRGDFNFNSNYLDLDELMGIYPEEEAGSGTSEATASSTETEPLLIPGDIDFKLASDIKKVRYNGIDVKNITGKVHMKDEIANLENLDMEAMGGRIGLTGSYNTQDHSTPKFDFGYKLKEIDIQQLAKNFITVEKLAPIVKFAHGKISSNFEMQTDLTPGLEPVLSSLSSLGDIRSTRLSVKGFKLLERIENKTHLSGISKQTFNNFKAKFTVHDGKVAVTPFDVKFGKINSTVAGYTSLDKDMHYTMKMQVPKEMIPASVIKEVEKGISAVNNLAPQIKVGELPNVIPVNVIAMGDPKNPKITTDLTEQLKKAAGDQFKGLVDDIKETVKDSITNIVNDQIDNVKEEIEKQKKAIMDQAQKQADAAKANAKKAADAVRKESNKQADEVIKAAGNNPIKKKLAEKAAEKIRKEGEEKAKKVEAEGNKKADDIMKKAQAKADGLG